MMFRRLGLQGKIVLITAVAVISVVAVSTYIAMLLTRQLVEEDTYRKALAQARSIAQQLVDEHALENPPILMRALRQLEHDFPGITQADVFTHVPRHELVATTDPDGQVLELDTIRDIENYDDYQRAEADQITIDTPDGNYWIMGTAIRLDGRPVACLNLKVSKLHLSVITERLVLRNLLVTLAGLAFLILVMHVFFLRSIRKPVKEMIRVMDSAEGKSLQARAPVRSHDEIGQLAERLNRMLARVESFSAELGQKVQDATGELASRNEDLRRINEELFETQKTLARSERLAIAGQLAAGLAHEIGTPLNSISGHVQLLARRGVGGAAGARRLEIIERQIDSIVRSVKQLLSWTRQFDLRLEKVDLARLLEDSLTLSSPALEHRHIRVVMDWARQCPPVYADPGYLQQVFLNLINNSMDAMPSGGTLTTRTRFPASDQKKAVVIEVQDTGVGIAHETLQRIFEPMFTTKRLGTGAGLGLAISEQIIRQHKGTIQADSEPGRGSRFTIALPVDCRELIDARTDAPRGFKIESPV
ncbi:MAG TPA: ATP-binding protein [Terriglobia bacterium]|nr:ATP-binding protein [Terriglobia bacterium]